jgi:hypothetical protein
MRASPRLKDAHDSWSGSQLCHLGQQLPTQGQGFGFPRKHPRLHSNRRSGFGEVLIDVTSSQEPFANKYFDAFAPQLVPQLVAAVLSHYCKIGPLVTILATALARRLKREKAECKHSVRKSRCMGPFQTFELPVSEISARRFGCTEIHGHLARPERGVRVFPKARWRSFTELSATEKESPSALFLSG